MKVRIDAPRCIAAGQCVVAASTVFDQSDDDGSVILLKEMPSASEEQATRNAARLCPALAILIDDDK
jgi:ferredoxin